MYILINNVPTDNVKKDSLLLSWDSVKRTQAVNPEVKNYFLNINFDILVILKEKLALVSSSGYFPQTVWKFPFAK